MKTYVSWLVVLAAAPSCGVKHLPQDILSKLSYEAKIELLEAENDLALAVDRLDEVRSEVARMRGQIRRAKDRRSAASSEMSAARDALSREVAQLAVNEAERRVDYLRARQRVNGKEEALAEQNFTCAQARFEAARLAVARKAKLEGSERLEPADFEQQVKQCDATYATLREGLKETTAEANTVRAEWEKSRVALAKKTFDARASPFVE